MGTIDIDYTSLGVGLLLLLIPVYFLWRFQNGITETYSNWCRTNDHSVVFYRCLSPLSV